MYSQIQKQIRYVLQIQPLDSASATLPEQVAERNGNENVCRRGNADRRENQPVPFGDEYGNERISQSGCRACEEAKGTNTGQGPADKGDDDPLVGQATDAIGVKNLAMSELKSKHTSRKVG
jgi:hypothetical protein